MRLIALTCNHCGAPLEVPKAANFVTCTYCETRLKVHTEGGAAFTETIGSIDQRTRDIAEDVEAIRAHQQLEQLDREWLMDRQRFQVRGEDGELSVPSMGVAMIGSIAVSIFGVFWIIMAINMGAPFFFPLFGVFFIVFALAGGISMTSKAKAFGQRQHEYQRHRNELQRRLRGRDE